jgi:hypothetical protein
VAHDPAGLYDRPGLLNEPDRLPPLQLTQVGV